MPADATVNGLPDAGPLNRLVQSTRRLLRSTWVITGLGLTVGLFLGTVVATTGADMILPLDPAWNLRGLQLDVVVRLLALLLIVVPACLALFSGVVRPLFRRLAAVNVARRIEQQIPGIHNRLVSVLDLSDPRRRETVSPTFHRRLLGEALERIRNFHPRQVLDVPSLRKAGFFAFSSTAAFALAWILFSDRLPTAMARIINPFADIPPAGHVHYAVKIYSPTDDEDSRAHEDEKVATVSVLREEDIVFEANVSQGEPKKMRIELRSDKDNEVRRHELIGDKNNPNRWALTLDSARLGKNFQDGFRARVYGGGTWSRQYHVNLVERPIITGTQTAIHYPAYMGKPEPRINPPQTPDVAGPEQGEVEVIVQADGQVARGEVQLVESSRRKISQRNQSEKVWFEDKVPVGSTAEGSWVWEHKDRRQVHTEPPSVGAHTHLFQGDPVGQAIQDGDTLFAHVFIPAGNAPEAIMMQWHDGDTWDHGAYWGQDLFRLQGKANTASRRHLGPVPETGKWVRLEVPAAAVGLEGKLVRGLAFWLYGGQVFWHRTGTVRTEEPTMLVLNRFPMKQLDDGRWSGRFPLTGTGLYRAELRNSQGHPNKAMPPAKYTALPDQPPIIAVERPASDVTLSKAAPLPLTVVASDDYGLQEINLLVRGGDGGDFQMRNLARFEQPEVQRQIVATLAETANLSLGSSLRYVVEAKDRKGQVARTREYLVRISVEGNTADQQLIAFDKAQDPFRERLIQLMADQKKSAAKMEQLIKDNAPLLEKVKKIEEQARLDPNNPVNKIDPKTGQPLATEPVLALDAETAKKLADLQKALNDLANAEDALAKQAQLLNSDLATQVDNAMKLDLLPRPIADAMKETQSNFDKLVSRSMQDLAAGMRRNADPKENASPDLATLDQQTKRILKELDAIKGQQDALAESRKGMHDDAKEAVRKLRQDMLDQAAEFNTRELDDLGDSLAKMVADLKGLMQQEEQLTRDATMAKSAEELERIEKKQVALDKELEHLLGDVKMVLKTQEKSKDKRRADRMRRPDFPDAPFIAETDEVKVPPKEEDTDEPLPGKKDKDKDKEKDKKSDAAAGKRGDKKDDDDEKEDKFMPALGGPRQKVDERFKDKARPVAKKDKGEPSDNDPDARRNDLQDRQNERLRDLDAAQKSLTSDRNSLNKMRDDQHQAKKASQGHKPGAKGGKGSKKDGEGEEGKEGEALQKMLESQMNQTARAMANRMKQTSPFTGKPRPNQAQRPPQGGNQGNRDGNQVNGVQEAELAKLDPATRALILKLPVRLREDLLQGMQEEGPDGYTPFIQDYFKRLTETKAPSK